MPQPPPPAVSPDYGQGADYGGAKGSSCAPKSGCKGGMQDVGFGGMTGSGGCGGCQGVTKAAFVGKGRDHAFAKESLLAGEPEFAKESLLGKGQQPCGKSMPTGYPSPGGPMGKGTLPCFGGGGPKGAAGPAFGTSSGPPPSGGPGMGPPPMQHGHCCGGGSPPVPAMAPGPSPPCFGAQCAGTSGMPCGAMASPPMMATMPQSCGSMGPGGMGMRCAGTEVGHDPMGYCGATSPPSITAPPSWPPPGRQVFLAPATASITPKSSRPSPSSYKQIALEFVSASQERQAEMFQDPAVQKAIFQTLAESPQAGGGSMASLLSQAGAASAPAPGLAGEGGAVATAPAAGGGAAVAPPPAGVAPWTGIFTLARNSAKRLSTRASLLHGKVQDVEVCLRSAAGNHNVLDITHRVPFEDACRRVANGTVVSMTAQAPHEHFALEEYVKYFRTKMRAGMVRLDGNLALYVLPPGEDIPALRDNLYVLGPHIPRSGCLLGLVAVAGAAPAATARAPAKPAPAAAQQPADARPPAQAALPAPAAVASPAAMEPSAAAGKAAKGKEGDSKEPPSAASAAGGSKAEADGREKTAKEATAGDGGAAGGDDVDMSSTELLDLFTNPELIKLLSDGKGDGA